MKKLIGKSVTPISEAEYSNMLREIAVRSGLQLPESPEEIKYFEEQFADEIKAASRCRPSLESMLFLAKELKNSGAPIANPEIEEPETAYAMAARNGKGITSDTEELMERALQKAREKRQDGD